MTKNRQQSQRIPPHRLTTAALIATILVSCTLSIQNCIQLDYSSNTPRCSWCYNSYPTDGGLCVPFPKGNMCQSSNNNDPTKCDICLQGYAQDLSSGKCVKLKRPIKGCTGAYIQNNKVQCVLCQNGYPSNDLTRCNKNKGYNFIEYCIEGYRQSVGNISMCNKCKRGFVVGPSGIECLQFDRNRFPGCESLGQFQGQLYCNACRAFEGYFAVRNQNFSMFCSNRRQKLIDQE